MKTVLVHIKGTSPYSQSRKHDTPKLDKEGHDAHEVRTWREKCTVNAEDEICIPAMAFKMSLDRVAVVLGIQIPGRGKNTYSKHFAAGCMCTDDVPLGIYKKDVEPIHLSCNSDGNRRGGKRVTRIFPMIPVWNCKVQFAILDDTITKDVFELHLRQAGQFVGVGRFRPENGGLNGRFECVKFVWQ